jgi:hypothetical protein
MSEKQRRDEGACTSAAIPLPRLSKAQDGLLRAAFHELLATTAAVSVERLGELCGTDRPEAEAEIGRLTSAGRASRDHRGDVTGALGLTIERTSHELHIGHALWHTWCVIDGLGILGALGRSGSVRSKVPITADPVEVAFHDGVPVAGDLNFVIFVPEHQQGTSVISTWCPSVNFFPDVTAAQDWARRSQVPGRPVTLEEATAAATQRWRERLEA